ncbi:hypothetical protein K1T71_010059 [Dendrolimus kikuchii]|uniref:Uncharacterized protein n=1 Tax=Dendrolimus kikuchii TaxID=765133 RepID=A0ACC1CQL0_9NEOP|nr:hypothetical protein K1T71_010059 [Dendrolimus kikuchii]
MALTKSQSESTGPTCVSTSDFQHDGLYTNRRLYVSENLNMWSFKDIFTKLGTHQQCLAFSEQQGLILKEKMCPKHHTVMNISYTTGGKIFGTFRCGKRTRKPGGCLRISRKKGTFFENTVLDIVHVYYLIYAYSRGWSYDNVIFEDPYKNNKFKCLSRNTISDWFTYCKEAVIIYYLEKLNTFSRKIGGPGKIVQIDKSKFGKQKHKKGRYNEGHWVLGLIEDGSEDLRLEVCPENVTSSDVIIPLIQKHVEVGTTLHTDSWHAYDHLSDYGYMHKKLNHSDPDNPNSTVDRKNMQRIESQWRVAKRFLKLKNFNDDNFADLLIEYLWRRNIIKYKKDAFLEVISAVKYVYKVE